MKILITLFCMLLVSCEGLMDYGWAQCFDNNSDQDIYFYLDYYLVGDIAYPAYDGLKEKPTLILAKSHKGIGISMWPTAFEYGTLGHMYAFSPDTLRRYSWEEVLAKKKYWFTARPCRGDAIQFPEEFEYMGDM